MPDRKQINPYGLRGGRARAEEDQAAGQAEAEAWSRTRWGRALAKAHADTIRKADAGLSQPGRRGGARRKGR